MNKETRQKLIEAILKKFKPKENENNSIALYIANELDTAENIEKKISDCKKYEITLRKDLDEKLKNNNNSILTVQNHCEHLVTKYWPDASGNNDSTTECQICGKEL